MAEKSLKDLSNAVYKIAENSPKIQKDVNDIRDAVCGTNGLMESMLYISGTLTNMSKKNNLEKLGLGSKTETKSINRHQKSIIKSTDNISKLLGKIFVQIQRMGKKGGDVKITRDAFSKELKQSREKNERLKGISKSIEIIETLRNISLKDFLFAKKKLNQINKIMRQSLDITHIFKNSKEMKQTMDFIDSSISLVKRLGKIAILSKPVQLGVKMIERIFLGRKGKGGLIRVFTKLSKHDRQIKNGKKAVTRIAAACGSLLITSMLLTGIAIVGPGALLGALVTLGIVTVLIFTFKLLDKSKNAIIKGAITLTILSAGIVAFSLGLNTMIKATRDLKLEDVGVMIGSIVGIGLGVAALGLALPYILPGAGVLILLGASLGILALSLNAWKNIDSKKCIGNVEVAIEGLRSVFGLDLGKHSDEGGSPMSKLTGGIMDIAMSILQFGKSLFVMGTILLAGAALGLLYHGLKKWENFNATKSIKNIKSAVTSLKELFGLQDSKDNKSKFKALLGGPLELGLGLMQMGKTFITMATLMIATAMSNIIRVSLKGWEKFKPTRAVNNLKDAISSLRDVFGLNKSEGFGSTISSFIGGPLELGISLMRMGKTFITMATLMVATGISGIIKSHLREWDNYDPSKAIGNMSYAVNTLKSLFGLGDVAGDDVKGGLLSGVLDLFSLGKAFIDMGKVFVQMGTLLIATAAMEKIKENLKSWDSYDPTKAIGNIKSAVSKLKDAFGLYEEKKEEESSGGNFFSRAWNGIKKTVKSVGRTISNVIGMGENLSEMGNKISKLQTLMAATATMATIQESLTQWDGYDASKPISNIKNAVGGISNMVNTLDREIGIKSILKFKSVSHGFSVGMDNIKSAFKNTMFNTQLKNLATPIEQSVKSVNALDLSKAKTMVDMFTSFSKIRGVRPFDTFNTAVNKFVKACNDMVDSIENLANVNTENTSENTQSDNTPSTKSANEVTINNVQQIVEALAQTLRGLNIRLDSSMLDINLIAEGVAGKSVKLTLQD